MAWSLAALAIGRGFCHGHGMDLLTAVEARMRTLLGPTPWPRLGPMVCEHLQSGGKRLRARLALEAAQALGVDDDEARVAWAAAVELMHNATLVHDDLQDGDTLRRGRPTLWAQHGMAQAINAGDLMLMAPFMALDVTSIAPTIGFHLCQALSRALMRVIEGQAAECAMTEAGTGSADAYATMIRGKTAALFALPVWGAALMAGHSAPAALAEAAAFEPLGELFQLQDDVLDLYGNKARAAQGSDLYEGKVSALVVRHVTLSPEDGPWLTALLKRPRHETTPDQVADASARFIASGAVACAYADMRALADQAHAQVSASLAPLLGQLVEQVMAPIGHLETSLS